MPPVSARQELKPAQHRALALMRDGGEPELTRGGYQDLAGVSRSQAAYDLAELVQAGVLERIGRGRSTRYVLAQHPNLTRRHWTSERIRAELASFCAERQTWPSAKEFKAAGHADLYVAASRYGGVAFWAAELRLDRGARRWEKPSIARLKLSLSWGLIGAVAGAVAVGATVAIVQGLPHGSATPEARRATPAAGDTASARKSSRSQTRRSAKATPAKTKVERATARHTPSTTVRSSAPSTAVLAVRTVSPSSSPASTTTASSEQVRTNTASSSSGGPAPLMAPNSSGTPPPLPAPGGGG
jgi:Transcriptional regulator DIP2311-like, C-terminal domain